MKIAEVVINTPAKSLDRTFHYILPDNMEAKRGSRVEVPFGQGNKKMLGYITEFTDSSHMEELKEIIKVLDPEPLISKSMLNVARYIRKSCLCSLSDAIRLTLPPSVKVDYEKIIELEDYTVKLTPVYENVVEILKLEGKKINAKKLKKLVSNLSDAVLKTMEVKGIIKITEVLKNDLGEKTRKIASLIVEEEDAKAILPAIKKRGTVVAKAFEMLVEYGTLPLTDLILYTNVSRTSLSALKRDGLIDITEETVNRIPYKADEYLKTGHNKPTEQQEKALNIIYGELEKENPKTTLLYGVTGSGKTEVFLQAAKKCIDSGKNAIILVPEIALTPQMTGRFVERFGSDVAVIHSGLSLGERYDEWRRIKSGQVKVAVGARSAIFAPFENIGLIVIDEEQEQTYKSDFTPRYNAKDVAAFRAKEENALLLLASATPSFESFYKAKNGEYNFIVLDKRFNLQVMPRVIIVNMAKELSEGNRSIVSRRLAAEIEQNLKNKEQTILFLNRRGYSTFISCRNCGYIVKCPNCSVSLTYHSSGEKLSCHYCGYKCENVKICPECKSGYIKFFGSGTQKAEEELKKIFPFASILRMDTDTASHKMAHKEIFDKFAKGHADILLGTQMVAKGLDFPSVTLVGVIAADAMLNINDIKAGERAFSQILQVCGRAGRGDIPGRAVIQTYTPDNSIINLAAKGNFEDFYDGEITIRKALNNPPFTKIINIVVSSEKDEEAREYANEISKQVKTMLEGICVAIYPAAEAPILKIKNRYRYRILLKTKDDERVYNVLEEIYNNHIDKNTKISLTIDINPNSIL